MGLVHELYLTNLIHAKNDNIRCEFCGETLRVFRHEWWKDSFKKYSVIKNLVTILDTFFLIFLSSREDIA